MGKKSKKIKTTKLDLGGKKLIEFHTACLNKHGELKGKNKKETQVIKDTCLHHKIGRKGKVKSRVDVHGSEAHCTMCGHDFPTDTYDKETRKKVINDYKELLDHTKFIAAAVGADENTLRNLAEQAVGVRNVKNINKKCTKIVKKTEIIKNKKKKNQNSSDNLGGWNVRR